MFKVSFKKSSFGSKSFIVMRRIRKRLKLFFLIDIISEINMILFTYLFFETGQKLRFEVDILS